MDLPETRDLFYPEDPTPVDHRGASAMRIGRDIEAEILLLESGAVLARLDEQEGPINASVEQYRASLEAVGAIREGAGSELPAQEVADKLGLTLSRIDQGALENADGYWRIILEQLANEHF